MRIILATLAACCIAPLAQAQNAIPAKDIANVLPGRWAMEVARPPGTRPVADCKNNSMRIWFEGGGKAPLSYFSRFIAPASDTSKEEIKTYTSTVQLVSSVPGFGLGGIVIQYEGEERLDDKGKPVVWILVMPDRDTFYWHRADWPEGSVTAPSLRCPEPEAIG